MPTSDSAVSSVCRRWARLTGVLLWLLAAAGASAQDIKIGGTGAALGTMQLLAQAYAKAGGGGDARITVLPSMGSGGGIKAVLAGAIQIAVSSRALSEGETKAGAVSVEYGQTPFVFATASNNPAIALTTSRLADYYAGRVDEWPDGSKVRLILRPIGDSDSETIKAMSGAMREAKSAAELRKGMLFTVTDQETATAIEKTAGALGPSTLALLLSERRALKALPLDGVVPSTQTIANGSYPLVKHMQLVTGPKTPPEALAFIRFVQSAAGQDLLRQTGHWVK